MHRMTWGQFKALVEREGITDSHPIGFIEMAGNNLEDDVDVIPHNDDDLLAGTFDILGLSEEEARKRAHPA